MRNNRIANRNKNALTICGKIKIGQKHETKGYPQSLDYFRPTGQFAAEFTKQYGEQPKKILIFFPNENALIQEYELHVGTVRRGVSDGLTVEVKPDEEFETNVFANTDKAETYMKNFMDEMNAKYPAKHPAKWQLSCKMKFLLYELRGIMGLWQFETKGAASMVNQLANAFDNAISIFGNITSLPFWLTVEKVKSNKKVFPVVSLNPAISFGQLIELKTGASSVPELLENTINMLKPKQKKAIETPKKKTLSEKQIGGTHQKIEDGSGNVLDAIEYFRKDGYEFDDKVFTTPRPEFITTLIDSTSEDEANRILQEKGYDHEKK